MYQAKGSWYLIQLRTGSQWYAKCAELPGEGPLGAQIVVGGTIELWHCAYLEGGDKGSRNIRFLNQTFGCIDPFKLLASELVGWAHFDEVFTKHLNELAEKAFTPKTDLVKPKKGLYLP